jgi:hypothetical protein
MKSVEGKDPPKEKKDFISNIYSYIESRTTTECSFKHIFLQRW